MLKTFAVYVTVCSVRKNTGSFFGAAVVVVDLRQVNPN